MKLASLTSNPVRIAALMLLAALCIVGLHLHRERQELNTRLLEQARGHFGDLVTARLWNAGYGGVYVEKKPGVESNPYLEDPDVSLTDGRVLTLRNPATMTRELSTLGNVRNPYKTHITSLKLKNPGNAPEPWERAALESFEKGAREFFDTTDKDGARLFRYMAPLHIEQPCLKCHHDQDYKIGDVRGGVSVVMPMDQALGEYHESVRSIGLVVTLLLLAIALLVGKMLRQSESAMARAENILQKNSLMLDNALVGVVHLENRVISDCNTSFAALFGYDKAELIGLTTQVLYANDRIFDQIGAQAYATLSRYDEFVAEVQMRRKGGEVFWASLRGRTLDKVNPVASSIWHYEDITERKQATDEAAKLLRAIEHCPVSVIITTREGIIEYVNPAFCALTGYTRREAQGQTPRLLQSGQTPDTTYATLWQTILSGGEWRGRLQNRRKNGALFWEDVSISPVSDVSGGITHFIAVKEDITERIRIEEELAQHQSQLESLVEERTRALNDALREAEAASRAKSDFLSHMSHEIRTPLNAVLGFARLLQQSSLTEQQRDYVSKLGSAGDHLLDLVNDVLDLSRIASGRIVLSVEPINLGMLIDNLLATFALAARHKRISLTQSRSADLPDDLLGDEMRLTQVLTNLIGNALKFTEQGCVDLVVSLVACDAGHARVAFAIRDTGIGMTPDEMGHIFEAFSQGDPTITRRFGGSGLGLAIARDLVALMGGTLNAESEKGRGSTFRFQVEFERGDKLQLPAPPTAGDGEMRFEGVRILLAEDQLMNQQVASELLASRGIEVSIADNGQICLDDLVGAPPGTYDLVLMDIQMPVMDGLTAMREIRARPEFRELPIIAMTAHVLEEERRRSLDAGANEHIGKPFVPAQLFALIARHLAPEKVRWHEAEKATPAGAAGEDDVIDRATGLQMFNQKADRYESWLKRFAAEQANAVADIRQALAGGDTPAAGRRAHSLKGLGGTLGLNRVHVAAACLEQSIKESAGIDAALAELAAALDQAFERIHADHAAGAAEEGTQQSAPLDEAARASLAGALAELGNLLRQGSGDSLRRAEEALDIARGSTAGLRLQHIVEHLNQFDFAAAESVLKELQEELEIK